MATSETFDFASYVCSIIPNLEREHVNVELLQGGFSNFTARITVQPPVIFQSCLIDSVILKQAPPYMANDPSYARSLNRQSVEAKALQILNGNNNSYAALASIPLRFERLSIPKLVFHDNEKHVLWMSDLGRTPPLNECLLSESSENTELLQTVLSDLGHFLAKTYHATRNPSEHFIDVSSLSTMEEAYQYLDYLMQEALTKADIPNAAALVKRVTTSLAEQDIAESALGMIDMWPGNVLIDVPAKKFGLVDWEYFGVTSPPCEVGMFMAHFHIYMLNATISQSMIPRTQSILHAFLKSFASHFQNPSLHFKRKTLLSHGRELITGPAFYSSQLDETSKARIINAGVRSLKAAGDSEAEMDFAVISEAPEGSLIWPSFTVLGF